MKTLYRNFYFGDGDRAESQRMVTIEGTIIDRGPLVETSGQFQVQDLAGRRIQPKYLDNHCHVLPTGLDLAKLNLSDTDRHAQVLDLLSKRNLEQPEGWLLAVHYDHNRYGGAHLSRADLDAISSTRPILLRHSSGHAGVANGRALETAGISPSVENELGGRYERDAEGRLSGVLLEKAFERVSRAIPKPDFEQMVGAILQAGEAMADLNICCACDMQTGAFDLEQELQAYREAVNRGCKIAIRLYLQWGRVYGPKAIAKNHLQELVDTMDGAQCRVQGIKLFADGAIGAGTAAIYGSYADSPTKRETSGDLMYSPEELSRRVLTASEDGWQVSVHAIGDYAADLVMDAFEATGRPSNHRLEHAMILSDRQIERLQRVGCFVCLQPEFLDRFGGVYQTKLGVDRCNKLIRFRSLIDAKLNVSFSSDRPITAGDPTLGIKIATHRPNGFGDDENCTLDQATVAYTRMAARTTSDDHLFGSLGKGRRAEFFLVPES
jgi:predicted amidohydrolase YtcJ